MRSACTPRIETNNIDGRQVTLKWYRLKLCRFFVFCFLFCFLLSLCADQIYLVFSFIFHFISSWKKKCLLFLFFALHSWRTRVLRVCGGEPFRSHAFGWAARWWVIHSCKFYGFFLVKCGGRTDDRQRNKCDQWMEWIVYHWYRLLISLWFMYKNLHPLRRSVHNPDETVFERFIGGQTNRSGNNAQAPIVKFTNWFVPCHAHVLGVEFHSGHHASASACLVDIHRYTATVQFNLITHNAHVRLLA